MAAQERPFDWRAPAVWAVLLTVSLFAHAHVEVANEASRGNPISFDRALGVEGSSHLAIAVLLPVLYWLHRRWPIAAGWRNVSIHVLAVVPFSVAHTLGIAALRPLWFNGILGESYAFPITLDRLTYEFAKDVVNYALLSAAVVALRHLMQRSTVAAPMVVANNSIALPERFAVRKRGGSEVVVEVADIDWIEAAGNYAVLHVGGDTFEIRSSLAKLESELDPKRFVRVHKSHVVNIARVAEVTPWISGDWRIRMQDGAEVNLSRRYRQRFEALAPVRS
jgi:hypothetical protein